MPKKTAAIFLALCLISAVWASNTRMAAGGILTLSSDLVLAGSDTLEVLGTAADSCTITGNSFAIRTSGTWTGLVRILYTRLNDLGAGGGGQYNVTGCGFDLTGAGPALIQMEHCLVERSGTIKITNDGSSSTRFRHNYLSDSTKVPVDFAVDNTGFVFWAHGSSTAQKYFQGNVISCAHVEIFAPQWTIGGTGDTNSNIFIGQRVRLNASGSGTVASYNYFHNPVKWSQLHTIRTFGGAVCEYNVIRDGEWIVQFCSGEFRSNVICDIYDHNLYRGGNTGTFHHNLFLGYIPVTGSHGQMYPCMTLYSSTDQYNPAYGTTGIDIFNNVFDGAEEFYEQIITVGSGAWINSLRNNVFCGMNRDDGLALPAGSDLIAGDDIRYADYNCFYNPSTPNVDNYNFTIPGKTERTSDGFGKHDLPVGGAVNAQVDPKFKGPRVTAFPYNDADILAGRVTVPQMIREFFDRYTPAAGSPLIDAGDPGDGIGTDIGAVETGKVGVRNDKISLVNNFGSGSAVCLSICPNPVNKIASIKLFAPSCDHNGTMISIYDPAGKLVTVFTARSKSPIMQKYTWNASALKSGVYIVRVIAGKNVYIRNIIVSK